MARLAAPLQGFDAPPKKRNSKPQQQTRTHTHTHHLRTTMPVPTISAPASRFPSVPITPAPIMPIKVKICGLSTKATMAAAVAAGADYVGLVFYRPSPRNVTLAQAAELAAMARGRAIIVALLVDPDDDALREVMQAVDPDLVQLHGSETAERTRRIAELCQRPVMKAVRVASASDARTALDYKAAADLILFDARPPRAQQLQHRSLSHNDTKPLPGGNGMAFDWTALNGVRETVDFMLSGGLDEENVAAAITATGAKAVDVSSGVESAPGIKDIERIRRFIAAAKAAAPAQEQP